ncbi:CCAAT enhancer binding protein zeta [Phyllostomus discolor]|uniref:CCAAT enhancer binding protein zeta n=1 Tax=Phyllostomus discolor TaxID=89673 RepID=A0A834E3P5_9CHIR|nr:CCAAT enhancer binding protein zeta [Phyllostomus discolor]
MTHSVETLCSVELKIQVFGNSKSCLNIFIPLWLYLQRLSFRGIIFSIQGTHCRILH